MTYRKSLFTERDLSTWVMHEPGWYTLRGVGGIVQERDHKWWFYPLDGDPNGPHDTLKAAKKAAIIGA